MADYGVAVTGLTDLGRKRPINEDSHAWWVPQTETERLRRGILLVVADGMGGAQAGEKASRLAVETVIRRYTSGNGDEPLVDLRQAIEAANDTIYQESRSDPSLAGMGTTCTAVVLCGDDALIAHVGDSRAYLIREGQIRQLTQDHSLVAHLIERGQITPEQARVDPRRNVVTRSVGVGPDVEVDVECLKALLLPGDEILLCSDGLHGLLTDRELADIVSGEDLGHASRDLIELANQRGGHDNITVILARIEEGNSGASG
jgi:protein phosphatase